MKVIIEIENEEELNGNKDKLEKIKDILKKDLDIKYLEPTQKDILYNIEVLSWNMGEKKYQHRENLYER